MHNNSDVCHTMASLHSTPEGLERKRLAMPSPGTEKGGRKDPVSLCYLPNATQCPVFLPQPGPEPGYFQAKFTGLFPCTGLIRSSQLQAGTHLSSAHQGQTTALESVLQLPRACTSPIIMGSRKGPQN
jgi:hypothetical protein